MMQATGKTCILSLSLASDAGLPVSPGILRAQSSSKTSSLSQSLILIIFTNATQ